MNYNGYPQNMNGMYNSYPYPQMPNQSMILTLRKWGFKINGRTKLSYYLIVGNIC